MPMIGYEEAHKVVENNKSLYWDGWNIVDWKADTLGEMSKGGMLKDGKWGFYKTYEANENGWDVPAKYVR